MTHASRIVDKRQSALAAIRSVHVWFVFLDEPGWMRSVGIDKATPSPQYSYERAYPGLLVRLVGSTRVVANLASSSSALFALVLCFYVCVSSGCLRASYGYSERSRPHCPPHSHFLAGAPVCSQHQCKKPASKPWDSGKNLLSLCSDSLYGLGYNRGPNAALSMSAVQPRFRLR
jgi:hypothetical protein